MPRYAFAIYCLAICCQVANAASFQPLGDLPGGSFASRAFGVSADGKVVVGSSSSASGSSEAFSWSANQGIVGLGDLPSNGFFSSARAVTDDARFIAGGSDTPPNQQAARWNNGTGFVGLGDFPGGGFNSFANDISANGQVVVGRGESGAVLRNVRYGEAFRWSPSDGMVGLGASIPAHFSSEANAVSQDGSVIVGSMSVLELDDSGPNPQLVPVAQGLRWDAGSGGVGLGYLPGGDDFSPAFDVSNDGKVVVGYGDSNSGIEAYRWTDENGMQGLGDLPGGSFWSLAEAVSGDGSIVVGFSKVASGDEAFVWDAQQGMRSIQSILTANGIDLTGWQITKAHDISADGNTVVGRGINPEGFTEAWIAELNASGSEGDYDIDGDVDGADFLRWQRQAGQEVPFGSGADGNSDGTVDSGDLVVWEGNYGDTATAGFAEAASSTAVPEPTSILLLITWGGVLVSIRYGGRKAVVACIFLAVSSAISTSAEAAIREWNQPAFGTFSFGSSWAGGDAPEANDSAIFGSKTTTVNSDIGVLFLRDQVVGDNWFASGEYNLQFSNQATYTTGRVVVGSGSSEIIDGNLVRVPPSLPSSATLRLAPVTSFSTPAIVRSSTLWVGGTLFDNEPNPIEGIFIVEGEENIWTNESSVHIGPDGNRGTFEVRSGAKYRNLNVATGFSTAFSIGSGSFRQTQELGHGILKVADPETLFEIDSFFQLARGEAIFSNNAQGMLNLGASVSSGSLNINSFASVNISGALTLFGDSSMLNLEENGTLSASFMNLNGNTVVDDALAIARGGMHIGTNRDGNLRVTNGGQFIAGQGAGGSTVGRDVGVSGAATVTGSDSLWTTQTLNVGGAGNGNLTIERRGRVDTNRDAHIGRSATGHGVVIVRDVGSRWTPDNLTIGTLGNGEMQVLSSSAVSSGSFIGIGLDADAIGTVSVLGSSLSAAENIDVGINGTGSMEVGPGGNVSSRFGAIAVNSGSTGRVTLVGNPTSLGGDASWDVERILSVGGKFNQGGNGSLVVNEGGSVSVGGELDIWDGAIVDVSSGGSLVVGATGSAGHGGVVRVLGTGELAGTGEIRGDVINEGVISPGHSPGILAIDGDFSQSSTGVLTIEVGGFATGESDMLNVSGSVELSGEVSIVPLIEISMGTSIDFLSAGNGIVLNGFALVDGLSGQWQIEALVGQNMLRATALSDIQAIPEASTLLLAMTAATMLSSFSIRSKRQDSSCTRS